ncbi:sulfite exporter TauE/SafE family protein [Streptoalloteichus tenebrarius]|uniref:sulfite exporter TauE/SafE family protein n=1 Tax=Streptoalloteichus tenebrarius (strain ATCC 17920 / DSM 40477 / JCM 4838 / CBS 697.72 / NBRC 16177 / NCIMB 11028 / NRRL B-12390 / A12253. 1 / ISP 5477) TaxID=1933 RepID=UPI0020A604D4|nr:sulfite exporter TauE/SafE family protein [Streptoalloteichus tenebrarius]
MFALILLGSGCLTGVTTVLFGFGGGFITVPVVFAVVAATTGADAMHTAVATSTAVMVVNASWATVTQIRSGRLRREYLHPLITFIAVGSALGALAANSASDTVLHVLFIAYLAVTVVDSVVRRGFTDDRSRSEEVRPLSRFASTAGGVGIGAVASFLGVGGSVMTVPLLRRRGLPMAEAAAMANPLSVPVALVGTLVYALGARPEAHHPGQVGYVNLVAAAALLCGSLPTIAITRRVAGRVPDRVHAIAYVGFLVLVLVAMTITAVV